MISSARITCWPPRVRVGGTISSLTVDQPLLRGLPGPCPYLSILVHTCPYLVRGLPGPCPTSPADQLMDTLGAKCEGIPIARAQTFAGDMRRGQLTNNKSGLGSLGSLWSIMIPNTRVCSRHH